MPFTDKDGHLIKAFQREKHDTEVSVVKRICKTGVIVDLISFRKK